MSKKKKTEGTLESKRGKFGVRGQQDRAATSDARRRPPAHMSFPRDSASAANQPRRRSTIGEPGRVSVQICEDSRLGGRAWSRMAGWDRRNAEPRPPSCGGGSFPAERQCFGALH